MEICLQIFVNTVFWHKVFFFKLDLFKKNLQLNWISNVLEAGLIGVLLTPAYLQPEIIHFSWLFFFSKNPTIYFFADQSDWLFLTKFFLNMEICLQIFVNTVFWHKVFFFKLDLFKKNLQLNWISNVLEAGLIGVLLTPAYLQPEIIHFSWLFNFFLPRIQ